VSGAGLCPSEWARSMVGKPIKWTMTEPWHMEAEGICTAVIASGSTITNDDGEFHGVQFMIDTGDGGQTLTCAHADEGAPA
jgi:hypothetical protein